MDIDSQQLGRMMANTALRERRRVVEYLREQAGVMIAREANDTAPSASNALFELADGISRNDHGGMAEVKLPEKDPEPMPERIDLAPPGGDGLPPVRNYSDEDDIAGLVGTMRSPGGLGRG
jgi:hypothetical protein